MKDSKKRDYRSLRMTAGSLHLAMAELEGQYGGGFECSETAGEKADRAKQCGDHEAGKHTAWRSEETQRQDEHPEGRRIEEDNPKLVAACREQEARITGEARVRLREKLQHLSVRFSLLGCRD